MSLSVVAPPGPPRNPRSPQARADTDDIPDDGDVTAALIVTAEHVSCAVRVLDLDTATARLWSGRPVYGIAGDVLLLTHNPFAGTASVCYVHGTEHRLLRVVPADQLRVRSRPT